VILSINKCLFVSCLLVLTFFSQVWGNDCVNFDAELKRIQKLGAEGYFEEEAIELETLINVIKSENRCKISLAEAYHELAFIYVQYFQSNYEEAANLLKKAVALRKQEKQFNDRLVKTYLNLSICKRKQGLLYSAYQYMDSTEYYYNQIKSKDLLLKHTIDYNKAEVFFELGDYDFVENIILSVVNQEHFKKKENQGMLLPFYNILASLYLQKKQLKEAFTYFKKLETLGYDRWIFYPNYIHCFELANNPKEALRLNQIYFEEVKEYQDADEMSLAYLNFGWIYMHLSDYPKAFQSLSKAKPYCSNKERLYQYYDNMADLFVATKEPLKALENYHKALELMFLDYKPNNVLAEPTTDSLIIISRNYDHILEVLQKKASVLLSIFSQNQNAKYLEASIKHFEQLEKLYPKVFSSIVNESSRLIWVSRLKADYAQAIEAYYQAWIKSQDKKVLEKLLNGMENSKAIVLQQKLKSMEMSQKHLPKQWQDSLFYYNAKIKELDYYNKEQNEQELRQAFRNINERYETLIKKLKNEYPEFFKSVFDGSALKIDSIQKTLLKDEIFIENHFSNNDFYMLWITHNGYGVNKVSSAENLLHLNNHLRNVRDVQVQFKDYRNAAHILYKELFQPILQKTPEVKKIQWVPDVILGLLPIETLLTKPDNELNAYKGASFLINDYIVNYDYSYNSLKFKTTNEKLDFSVFSPDYENTSWPVLKYSNDEIKRIKDKFSVKVYKNKKATIENFLKESSKGGIVHLLMHGDVDSNVLKSKLVFADETELIVADIYKLLINKNLIYLSACNTGIGEVIEGEGVMSLARAFKYAGCPAIITSLWFVNDKEGVNIADGFYESYALGKRKDESMALSKRKYLEKAYSYEAHPFYWAALIPIGDNDTIILSQKSNNAIYYILGGILIISGLLIFALLKRRKRQEPL
jgi:CHAT domain-containing protein